MGQWDVVLVIVTLVGLMATVLAPVLRLIRAITRLTATMQNLEKNVADLSTHNSASHERIWTHARRQDEKLADHESRIRVIESDR